MLPKQVMLTEREMDVFKALLSGKSQKAISLDFGIAQSTVGSYCIRIRRKFGVRSMRELYAISAGGSNPSAELAQLRADAAGFDAWRRTLIKEIALATASRDAALRELEELRAKHSLLDT